MDGTALISLLAERGHEPLLVFDREHRVTVATGPLCKRLCVSKRALLGRPVQELLGTPEGALEHALCECAGTATSETRRGTLCDGLGRKHSVSFQIEQVPGHDGSRLCSFTFLTASRPFCGRDIDYEVEMRGARPGTLRRVEFVGGLASTSELGGPCYELIGGQSTACQDCPAVAIAAHPVGSEQTAVRCRSGIYELSTTTRISENLVRVRLRHVPEGWIRDLQLARIQQLAARAKLSPREQDVLTQVLHGATTADISAAMGISVRTVKFHHANLLAKLGVDSRADLLRVLA
ncbi:MAG: helix-turn-helix transcriptional regulator [Myxococcales bacterium]